MRGCGQETSRVLWKPLAPVLREYMMVHTSTTPLKTIFIGHTMNTCKLITGASQFQVWPGIDYPVPWLDGGITRKEELVESFDYHHRKLTWTLGMYFSLAGGTTPADVWEQARLA